MILELSRLAISDAFLGLHLIQDHEIDDLQANNNYHDNEHGKDFAETGIVAWCIAFGEEEGADNVAYACATVRMCQPTLNSIAGPQRWRK